MPATAFAEVIAAFPRVDEPGVLIAAQSDEALRLALDMSRPRNWQGTGAAHALLKAAKDEGIPLSWVPSADVIIQLASAATASERTSVLVNERRAILDACVEVVDECNHPGLSGDRVMVSRAAEAVIAGHYEAGMALATSVGEQLAHWAVEPRAQAFSSKEEYEKWTKEWKRVSRYRRIDLVDVDANVVEPWEFPRQVLLAPIHKFFVDYRQGDAVTPEIMSRHVVAHRPTPEHLSQLNALKSIMLVTGILRSQQDFLEDLGE
ncbi:hypothetical protein ACQI5H_23865 [Mycobacterium heidelbergense]|uniref:hypothetical protein n=1 Tax=Mycobacterium heidelbergense TaxID=53376 RepID=UPI003CF49FC5